ncbi:STAS domain-containing protein [Streptomyces sp. 21So2-11]|uniref:STAS domain-containing protein n=1 Tax=Streptomyces sp. 21So2-11 TaxID=3144408 RepID=UPI00321BEA89
MNTASLSHILPTLTRTVSGPRDDAAPSGHTQIVAACRTHGDTLVIALQGEIDRFTAAPLHAILTSAAAFGHTRLVIDATRITFCDSGFLNAVLGWRRRGRRLCLASCSPAVVRLLDAVHASGDRLARTATLEEALR